MMGYHASPGLIITSKNDDNKAPKRIWPGLEAGRNAQYSRHGAAFRPKVQFALSSMP
jgi:hypothetical protein